MSDLWAAVLTAIAERRKVAEAATPGRWRIQDDGSDYHLFAEIGGGEDWGTVYIAKELNQRATDESAPDAAHIAANDPTFTLANLDAWRQLVEDEGHTRHDFPGARPTCEECGHFWPCPTIVIPARLFLTAEQQAEYGIAETAPHAPHDHSADATQ